MSRSLARPGSLAFGIAVVIGLAGLTVPVAAIGQDLAKSARPDSLARYFPRQDLVVYAEFDGLDAHAGTWRKTAAYRLLNETTTGAMLEQTLAHLLDGLMVRQSGVPVKGRELVVLGQHLLHAGFAVGINRAGGTGPPRSLAVVIRGGAVGEPRSVLDRLLRGGEGPRVRVHRVEKPGGRVVQVLGDPPTRMVAWWSEGQDLVVSLVAPTGIDAVIGTLDGHEPSALDHPTRGELVTSRDARGFEPVGFAFFDMAALPPLPREAVALGLERIHRFDYRWGFHGESIQSIVGAVVPAPRVGIPALFDQPAFDVQKLPPLPGGLTGFTVLALDTARLHDQVVAAVKVVDPRGSQPLDQLESGLQQVTGLRLRTDVLAHLGSRWVIYTEPTPGNAPANMVAGLVQAVITVPKSSVIIEVKDREAVGRALDALAERTNRPVPLQTDPAGGLPLPVAIRLGSMQRLKAPDQGYVLRPSALAMSLPVGTRPTLLLGRKSLVLATSPTTARRARDRDERSESGGLPAGDPLASALEALPDRLVFLRVQDPRRSLLPDVLAAVPDLAELVLGRRGTIPFALFGLSFPAPVPPGPPSQGESPSPGMTPPFDPERIPEPDSIRPFLFPSASVLTVDDRGIRFLSREAFPTINPATAVPVALAMLIPATRSAHLAAQRAQSVNHLKQIGLAMHNFLSGHDRFPADVRGKDGKPLLSWRVQILPFLEQQGLFQECHMDEPWDSPHNRSLLERMPSVFTIPNAPAEPGMTFYRGFAGRHAIFDTSVPAGIALAEITDGTSNTIAVVEAREAVPWTKPEGDLASGDDTAKPEETRALLARLGGHFSDGFNALFCDGSVRFIKDTINVLVLRALITRDGGEVISADSF